MIKNLLFKKITYPLKGKKIYWSTYLKIYCDGGQPIFKYYPVFHLKNCINKFWKMYLCRIYFLGREFNFCFGKDINKMYDSV